MAGGYGLREGLPCGSRRGRTRCGIPAGYRAISSPVVAAGPDMPIACSTPRQKVRVAFSVSQESVTTEKPKVYKHLIQIQGTGGTILKVREIIKVIEAGGWYLVTTKGSHRQYKHPDKTGRITIAGHLTEDLAPGTMNSIFKQAHLKE
jgi:predicted RNA binding protein YcfA (HicA-like mRNA interferase family)